MPTPPATKMPEEDGQRAPHDTSVSQGGSTPGDPGNSRGAGDVSQGGGTTAEPEKHKRADEVAQLVLAKLGKAEPVGPSGKKRKAEKTTETAKVAKGGEGAKGGSKKWKAEKTREKAKDTGSGEGAKGGCKVGERTAKAPGAGRYSFPGTAAQAPLRFEQATVYTATKDKAWRVKQVGVRVDRAFSWKREEPEVVWRRVVQHLRSL